MPESRADGGFAVPGWLKLALVAGGVLLIVMVVELAVTLGVLQDSRQHIESQDAKVEALLEATQPLAERARPVLDDARPALERAAPLLGDLASLLDPLAPAGDDLAFALERFPLLEGSLRRAIAEAIPLLETLDPARLAAGAALTIDLVARLSEDDRLVAALDRAIALLDQVDDRRLVDRAVQADRTLRKVLEVQRLVLEVQRRTLETQRDSLAVQRRSLDHIRSLDAKTLGEFPPD